VRTWIMGIAYRKALKLLQKSRTWRSRFKAADWEESIEPVAASSEHTRDLGLEDLLYRGIRALSPKHRAVVELTYFHGCSYEEIAAIVDCPVNTVKTRMFHARVKLRELLPELSRDDIDT
jgi:RNA polymerase sigma factor (sigma-70 family)